MNDPTFSRGRRDKCPPSFFRRPVPFECMSLMDNCGIMIMQHLACNDRVDTRQLILASKKDSAALLGVCLRTIDNLIATKQLPADEY